MLIPALSFTKQSTQLADFYKHRRTSSIFVVSFQSYRFPYLFFSSQNVFSDLKLLSDNVFCFFNIWQVLLKGPLKSKKSVKGVSKVWKLPFSSLTQWKAIEVSIWCITISTSLDPLNIMLSQYSCLHLTMESFDFWTNLLAFIGSEKSRWHYVKFWCTLTRKDFNRSWCDVQQILLSLPWLPLIQNTSACITLFS